MPDARTPRDGRAVRLGAREYLGPGRSRVGRFAKVDPLRTPRWWGRWRWLGLLAFLGLVERTGRRAWREHGGLRGADGGPQGPDGEPSGPGSDPWEPEVDRVD